MLQAGMYRNTHPACSFPARYFLLTISLFCAIISKLGFKVCQWRSIEVGTFASAAGGRKSEQKGVAAVGIFKQRCRKLRAPQKDITGRRPG